MIDGFLVARALNSFLFGFTTLFALINPPAAALIFYGRTAAVTDAARVRLSRSVAKYAFFIIIGSLVLGSPILGFFGISVAALRMGGGLVVALAGYGMLTSTDDDDVATQTEAELQRSVFFPLTMPLTTGPGTIAAAIALGANDSGDLTGFLVNMAANLLMAVTVCAMIFLCFRYSARIARVLGKEGTNVVKRLTAFLLFCMGIQIFLNGFLEAMGPLARAAR